MRINAGRLLTALAGMVLGLTLAGSAWSAGTLEEVMKERGLTQKDLLAAAKTYTPTGGVKAMTDVLRRRGMGVIVGIQPKAPPVDVFGIFWKELQIIGARVYQRPDFEEAVRLVSDGTIPVDDLVSDVMPLEDTAAAVARLDGGEEVVKLLIACDG